MENDMKEPGKEQATSGQHDCELRAEEGGGPGHLTLRQIAAWQFPELVDSDPNRLPIRVGLPSLQRGAVWNAGQVELLWDSILRGFPIGSIVVCKKLEDQATRPGRYGNGWNSEDIGHHLLDGQQRCNAIALGFLDAIKQQGSEKPPAALWIDLDAAFPNGSTREFLFRMLTESHPWGYKKSDKEDPLTVGEIRTAVKNYRGERRPVTIKAWPHASNAPIPFAWLTTAAFAENWDERRMWEDVLAKLNDLAKFNDNDYAKSVWAEAARKCVSSYLAGNAPHLSRIGCGLRYAKTFAMVYLEVPPNALKAPGHREEQGEQSLSNAEDRIYNVEHLFQRLNNAGTERRGEELRYSMIKAYWPNIEKSFASICDKNRNAYLPMPESRLAALSARAALIDDGNPELPTALSVSGIRKLRFSPEAEGQKCQILRYLGIDGNGAAKNEAVESDIRNSDLHRNLGQIDDWLLFSDTNDIGIPPVLRSSLAQGAPEVFLLLLFLAQKAHDSNLGRDKTMALRKPLLGLATALHWFSNDQAKAVAALYDAIRKVPLSAETFQGILGSEVKNETLKLLTPEELAEQFPRMDHEDIHVKAKWNLYDRIVQGEEDAEKQQILFSKWQSIERVRNCKALLLYAQRAFLNREFVDYDPSCVDIWEGWNRPWDYDHILTAATLNNNQGFRDQCKQWANTIGNFRAWPLEKNRSRKNDVANNSITTKEELEDSLIRGKEECDAFSIDWKGVRDSQRVAAFLNAARDRMIRIYKDWFDSLEIGKLL